MKPKIYLETSIISYLAARPSRDLITAANQQVTHTWWDKERERFDVYVSSMVLQEVTRGDPNAAHRRTQFLVDLQLLELGENAVVLAEKLVQEKVVPRSVVEDALHIAVAACAGMDYVLTWNFRHIANAMLRNRIEDVRRIQKLKYS